MNIRKCIISTSIALSSLAVHAATASEQPRYQFVVFNDAGTVEKMKLQPLNEFIEEVKSLQNKRASYAQFEKLSGLCLAYLKQQDYASAEDSCESALNVAKKPLFKVQRDVIAYAYNNRGVVHAMASNNAGALDDFRSALDTNYSAQALSNLLNIVPGLNDM